MCLDKTTFIKLCRELLLMWVSFCLLQKVDNLKRITAILYNYFYSIISCIKDAIKVTYDKLEVILIKSLGKTSTCLEPNLLFAVVEEKNKIWSREYFHHSPTLSLWKEDQAYNSTSFQLIVG